jgi:hypothetical protein
MFYTGMLLYLFKNVKEYSLFKRLFCTNVVGTNLPFDARSFVTSAFL